MSAHTKLITNPVGIFLPCFKDFDPALAAFHILLIAMDCITKHWNIFLLSWLSDWFKVKVVGYSLCYISVMPSHIQGPCIHASIVPNGVVMVLLAGLFWITHKLIGWFEVAQSSEPHHRLWSVNGMKPPNPDTAPCFFCPSCGPSPNLVQVFEASEMHYSQTYAVWWGF